MNKNKDIVVKKIVYKVLLCLDSPLCVSAGDADSELTDADVIRDFDGHPFVPGSSLAGAMRAYLGQKKEEPGIFGYSKLESDAEQTDGKMSSLILTDLIFDGELTTDIRDSVKLTDGKISKQGAKFDMEVVNTGAAGHFYAELVVRSGDAEERMKEQVGRMFQAIARHEIRFGRKKTRGYGSMNITGVGRKEFDKSNILEYAGAYEDEFEIEPYSQETNPKMEQKYVTITAPLRLCGGISIRKYAAKKGEPDFVHITVGGKPVIPGTSMAGAIRHRVKEILQGLGIAHAQSFIDEMFGFVETKAEQKGENAEKEKAKMSPVVFEECTLEGAKPLLTVRNAISRFEAATKNGALYRELTYVGGTTTLTIKVKKDSSHKDEWIGYLLLALRDLENGYLAVGGQTAIGRGIFEKDPAREMQIDGEAIKWEKHRVYVR